MWRRPNCSETDSKTAALKIAPSEQSLDNCFDCKNFDDHVLTCDTYLELRDNIVTCASSTEKNSVFDNCPEYSRTTGECIELGEKPINPEMGMHTRQQGPQNHQ